MNITVYLGANEGNDGSFKEAVRELGTWIGKSGNNLVYGGSESGLMGEIAKSVLAAGGEATGVEPQFFIDKGFEYGGLTRLIAPCILYNLDGYYNSLKELLNHMIEKGLSSEERQKGIYFADTLEDIVKILG